MNENARQPDDTPETEPVNPYQQQFLDTALPILARRLTALMNDRRMNATDLSKVTGVNRTTIRRYMFGATKADLDNVYSISCYFGVSLDWMLGLDGNLSIPPESRRILELYSRASAPDQLFIRKLLSRYEEEQKPDTGSQ